MATSLDFSPGPSSVRTALDELQSMLGDLSLDGGKRDGSAGTMKDEATGEVDWERVEILAKGCADSLRTDDIRTSLSQTTLVEYTAKLLELSLAAPEAALATQTQLCRIVGNLVLDHPVNRVICLQSQIPHKVLAVLANLVGHGSFITIRLPAIKACTGALLNLTIDTPSIRNTLVGADATEILVKSLNLYTPGSWDIAEEPEILLRATIAEWTIKLLAELSAGEGSRITSSFAIALARVILALPLPSSADSESSGSGKPDLPYETRHTLVDTDLTLLSTASEILENHIYKDDSLQDSLATATNSPSRGDDSTQSILRSLLHFVKGAEILPCWLPFAKTVADDAVNGDQDNDGEEDELEVEKTFSNVKASAARIAIAIASSDKVMDAAFGKGKSMTWLVEDCIAWLGGVNREVNTRADLVITASTLLANLARKDEYCVSLVHDHNIARPLAFLLSTYAPPPTSAPSSATSSTTFAQSSAPPLTRPGEATQILHGVVGLLKNLAIAGPNKQVLCDEGVIEPAAILLREQLDMVLPLQNVAVGLLKHLSAGNVASALKIVLPPSSPHSMTSASPLSYILALIPRTNDVRLRSEATRLLANVIRSLYSSRSVTSPITPSALGGLDLGIARAKARETLEHSRETVEAISEMLRTGEKYPILVNEAIVALTLLSTTESGGKLTLEEVTKQHQVPANVPSENSKADPISTTAAAPSALARIANGENDSRSPSRRQSSSRAAPPPSSLDILLRWLTEYAIQAASMPAEMARNALSFVEALVLIAQTSDEQKKSLRWAELKSVLGGVVKRPRESMQEKAVGEAAERIARSM